MPHPAGKLDGAKHILIRHLTEDEVNQLKVIADSNMRSLSAEVTLIIKQHIKNST